MPTEARRSQWRNFHTRKIASMTPEELDEFRMRKAEYDKNYRMENRAKRMAYRIAYRHRCNEIQKAKYHHPANHVKRLAYQKAYYRRNKVQCRKTGNQCKKNRMKRDPAFRIKIRLAERLYDAIRGKAKKADTTMRLVGCTYAELRAHIESKFTAGMSWEKYGRAGIHIDHIRPCASYDLTNSEQQKACFHYTNLQPLWAVDNIRKRAKFPVAA